MTSLNAVMTDIHQKYEELKRFQTHGKAEPEQVREALVDLRDDLRAVTGHVLDEMRESIDRAKEAGPSQDISLLEDVEFAVIGSSLDRAGDTARKIDFCLTMYEFDDPKSLPQEVSAVMALTDLPKTVHSLRRIQSRLKSLE